MKYIEEMKMERRREENGDIRLITAHKTSKKENCNIEFF